MFLSFDTPAIFRHCDPALLNPSPLPPTSCNQGVKIGRAKQLLNAGFKKIADVADAEPQLLTKAIQFLSNPKVRKIVKTASVNRCLIHGSVLNSHRNLDEELLAKQQQFLLLLSSQIKSLHLKTINFGRVLLFNE